MNVFDYFFDSSYSLDKDLILGPREQISYQSIYSNSLKLADFILKNIGENNHILLLSENSAFFITAYLSILKSGNICIPLNPTIEEDAFNTILKKTNAKYAFVSEKFLSKYDKYEFNIYSSEDINVLPTNKNSQELNAELFDGNRIAEIIFTSGSTGEQKGVMITHNNIIANTDSIIDYLKLTTDDTIQIVMPFYYCYGLSLLHTHMKVGGSVILNNSFIFLGSVINDLKKYKCTGFAGVPSHFQILLRKTKDFVNNTFPDLKYVTQAGGKLHTAFITEFAESFPEIKFYVMYGQTEATARLSYLPPEMIKEKLGSIGKGIPGVELRVVDDDGTIISPGENGEIIAKGRNIMTGYFHDPDSTKETIRDGWLYTGDMATIDEDGYIFIQSRKKEIIKVRGIRISPKEIEEVIVTFPGVIDCSIEAIADEITGEALKAIVYINEADRTGFTPELIRAHCAKHLSIHKVPQEIAFESKLVFNASGKKTK